MSSSPYANVTDELLSAYLDDAVTPEERALVEAALAHDPAVEWRLQTLRYTVDLLHSLPQIVAPRAFVLVESQVADVLDQPRRRTTTTRPQAEPAGLWARLAVFWQSGNHIWRNAAAACAALLVVALVGTGVNPGERPAAVNSAAQPKLGAAAPARVDATPDRPVPGAFVQAEIGRRDAAASANSPAARPPAAGPAPVAQEPADADGEAATAAASADFVAADAVAADTVAADTVASSAMVELNAVQPGNGDSARAGVGPPNSNPGTNLRSLASAPPSVPPPAAAAIGAAPMAADSPLSSVAGAARSASQAIALADSAPQSEPADEALEHDAQVIAANAIVTSPLIAPPSSANVVAPADSPPAVLAATPTATASPVVVAALPQAATPRTLAPAGPRATAELATNWLVYAVIALAIFLLLFLGLWLASRRQPAQP